MKNVPLVFLVSLKSHFKIDLLYYCIDNEKTPCFALLFDLQCGIILPYHSENQHKGKMIKRDGSTVQDINVYGREEMN